MKTGLIRTGRAVALFCLCCVGAACAQSTDAVLNPVRTRIRNSDFRATGRLVRVNGASRVTTKFSLKGHWFPDGLRLLYEFDKAGGTPQRVLLHMDEHGRVTIQGAEPGGLEVPPEDLVEGQFFWPAQSVGATETIGPRTCTQLKSVPAGAAESRYAAVVSCVDASTGWPLKVEKSLRAGTGEQVVSYGGLRQSNGVWIATEIRMQAPGSALSTLLLIDHGTARARLEMKDFDLKQPAAAAGSAETQNGRVEP